MTREEAQAQYRKYQLDTNTKNICKYFPNCNCKKKKRDVWYSINEDLCVNCGLHRGEHIHGCCPHKRSIFSTGSIEDQRCEIKYKLFVREFYCKE